MISVLIAAYNAEKTIVPCVDSVLRQIWQDFEIVIVNDGSTDGTAAIVDHLAESDLRIRGIHQENQGLSAVRNRLVRESNGQELLFLDADDRLLPDCLRILHEAKTTAGVPCACCNHYIVHGGVRIQRFEQPAGLTVLSGEQAIAGMLYHGIPDVSTWGKLYNRELLLDIRYPEGRLFEDSYTIADILITAGKIVYAPEPLVDYVWSDNSLSKRCDDEHLWDFYDAVEHMTQTVEREYPHMKRGCLRRRAHAVMSVMRTLDPAIHKADWRKARKLLNPLVWPVLTDWQAPMRDKLGILASLPGHRCYRLIWRLYMKNRRSYG